jgi:hypothetical protein
MTPREIVLEQIQHRDTARTPYTLAFEEEVRDRLDEHYGGEAWREDINGYIRISQRVERPLNSENIG